MPRRLPTNPTRPRESAATTAVPAAAARSSRSAVARPARLRDRECSATCASRRLSRGAGDHANHRRGTRDTAPVEARKNRVATRQDCCKTKVLCWYCVVWILLAFLGIWGVWQTALHVFDRQEIMPRARDLLKSGNLLLLGPRRVGKISPRSNERGRAGERLRYANPRPASPA